MDEQEFKDQIEKTREEFAAQAQDEQQLQAPPSKVTELNPTGVGFLPFPDGSGSVIIVLPGEMFKINLSPMGLGSLKEKMNAQSSRIVPATLADIPRS